MRRRWLAVAFALLVGVCSLALVVLRRAATSAIHREPGPGDIAARTGQPSFEVPVLRGRVNDYANLLTPEQETELGQIYESAEHELGCQIGLLTIESLPGVRIEDYSLAVANAWQLGRRGIDDGVLITIASKDRSVRIEVGYGLELILSNRVAGDIIQRMVPEFAAGNYFTGIRKGSVEIVQRITANAALVGKRKP